MNLLLTWLHNSLIFVTRLFKWVENSTKKYMKAFMTLTVTGRRQDYLKNL